MSWFDLHPDFVTRNTSVNTGMKVRDNAENGQRYYYTDQEKPPARKEVSQQAKQSPCEKDSYTSPANTIAFVIKDGNAFL